MNIKNAIWYVYTSNFDEKSIERYNIFHHWKFCEYIQENYKKNKKDKEKFIKQLHSDLMYCFWSKFEWELLISYNDGCYYLHDLIYTNRDVKLNVTNDINFDWEMFYNYMNGQKYMNENTIKFDVYNQISFIWDKFSNYTWNMCKARKVN